MTGRDLGDPVELLRAAVLNAVDQTSSIIEDFSARFSGKTTSMDPLGIFESYQKLSMSIMVDPIPVWRAQMEAVDLSMDLWRGFFSRSLGLMQLSHAGTVPDRRFRDAEWSANPLFAFIKGVYEIYANTLLPLAVDIAGPDRHSAHQIAFYTRQFLDAIAPSNFALSNPEVLRKTLETGGTNLVDGLRNLLEDIDPLSGKIRTKMVDGTGFELGRNIAASPGAVVYQNELMQLIQYAPSTPSVRKRPLLIVPPWINKYYILDLQPKNSFIRWAVEREHTVFVISWVNPDSSLRDMDFSDYMRLGPLAALGAIAQATGEPDANAIGYCIGGTLLGATLAYMQATGDYRIKAATFFTALLDFSEPGDLGVFIDDRQISNIEERMNAKGYLDGKEMATAFNLLRANDLIWSFVVNNYLLGNSPAPFDLLYWNADSTRMPARMHSTYLRNMYRENLLREPGGIVVDGVKLDLGAICIPACFVSTIEDHIAPWTATFRGAQLLSGEVTFILGKAGHVAGVINPPGPRQYGHMTGAAPRTMEPDAWLSSASNSNESWWNAWNEWVTAYADGEVPARVPGDHELPVLDQAPGAYVKVRYS